VNKNTRLTTALYEDAFAECIRTLDKNPQLIALKLTLALAEWALDKMGSQSARYTRCALEDFQVRAANRMVKENWDAARALREIPFVIPARPRGSNPSMYQLLMHLKLLQIDDDYVALCDSISKLKKKNNNGAVFRRDLKTILTGCAQRWIIDVELSAEPSDIALLYLTQRNRKLGIKPEMLKKRLAQVKQFAGVRKTNTKLLKLIERLYIAPPKEKTALLKQIVAEVKRFRPNTSR
jgi:hypothetical protein